MNSRREMLPDEPRDPRLQAALSQAPDHAVGPPATVSAAVLRAARDAVAPSGSGWRRWWASLGGLQPSRWAPGTAGLMVALLVGMMWWGEEPPPATTSAEPQGMAQESPPPETASTTATAPTTAADAPTAKAAAERRDEAVALRAPTAPTAARPASPDRARTVMPAAPAREMRAQDDVPAPPAAPPVVAVAPSPMKAAPMPPPPPTHAPAPAPAPAAAAQPAPASELAEAAPFSLGAAPTAARRGAERAVLAPPGPPPALAAALAPSGTRAPTTDWDLRDAESGRVLGPAALRAWAEAAGALPWQRAEAPPSGTVWQGQWLQAGQPRARLSLDDQHRLWWHEGEQLWSAPLPAALSEPLRALR